MSFSCANFPISCSTEEFNYLQGGGNSDGTYFQLGLFLVETLEEDRFFEPHIREAIKLFKEIFKKNK